MPTLRYTNAVLTLLAVLLSANLWVLISGPAGSGLASEANAQGVSNNAQRQVEILSEVSRVNDQLTAINANLVGGLRVEVVSMPGE